MDFLETYNPTNVDRLMLHDIAYKCSCMTCSQGKPEEDYDVLSSSLNPNIKAGFARYRDHRDKQPDHQVEPLKLSYSEIESIRNKLNTHGFPHEKVIALSIVAENCKTQLFSGSMELMKNVLTSSIDNNQYNPFGTFHSIELKKPVPADGIEGYKRLDDTTWECLFCKRVTNIDSDDFLCLRVIDVVSKRVKNSCCVDLKKHGYSIVSYTWNDINEVCDIDNGDIYLGIDGKPLDDKMQMLLQHTIKSDCAYMWLDQVCIDQSNTLDKEISVARMDKTYSFCDMCVICLRKATVDTLNNIALIQGIPRGIHSDFTESIESCILAFLDFSIILSLINDPWFSRGWTLQEVVLPKKVVVARGSNSFGGLDWMFEKANMLVGRMMVDTSYIAELFSISLSRDYLYSVTLSLASQLDGISTGRKGSSMGWDSVAKIMSSRQTGVKLDQVFCLGGILPKSRDIQVDYSADPDILMEGLAGLYPESSSSLFFAVSPPKDHALFWSQYRCLPPLKPIENPTNARIHRGKCTFENTGDVDGSIIRGCLETGRAQELDIDYMLGDATHGVLKLLYPDWTTFEGPVGKASHMFRQLEIYARTWSTERMMVDSSGKAFLAFVERGVSHEDSVEVWMGDKRSFECADYAAPLYTEEGYIGWSFCQ